MPRFIMREGDVMQDESNTKAEVPVVKGPTGDRARWLPQRYGHSK